MVPPPPAPRALPRAAASATALALALAASTGLAGCSDAPGPRPNVLLLSLDSVRPDDLTPYGARSPWRPEEVITPAIARLAAEGTLFEHAISTTSWTLPSHMALLTGLPDALHGVTNNDHGLDPALDTLAEVLSRAGYRTAGFFSGPNLNPVYGFGAGFDAYVDCSSYEVDPATFLDETPGALLPVHHASHEDVTSPALYERASAFLEEAAAGDAPFFAFVHWWDPHYDYRAPAAMVERFRRPGWDPAAGDVTGTWQTDRMKSDWDATSATDLRALYHAELAYTDSLVGALLARLDDLGLADDTLVVLVADHGEEFFEHERWGHQRTLHGEVVAIPMIARLPGVVPAGLRAAGQARLQDVFATVLDLADLAPPVYSESASLRALWEDPDAPGEPQVLRLDVPNRAVDQWGLQLPATPEGARPKVLWEVPTGRGWVTDVARDPGEQRLQWLTDLPNSRNPLVQRLLAEVRRLEETRRGLPSTPGHGGIVHSAEHLADLDAAGYLGGEDDQPPPTETPSGASDQ